MMMRRRIAMRKKAFLVFPSIVAIGGTCLAIASGALAANA